MLLCGVCATRLVRRFYETMYLFGCELVWLPPIPIEIAVTGTRDVTHRSRHCPGTRRIALQHEQYSIKCVRASRLAVATALSP